MNRTLFLGAAAALIGATAAIADDTATVRVLHASPDAPAVDVLVNDGEAFSNVSFGDITERAALMADTYNIKVAAAADNLLAFNTESADELLTSGESAIAQVYSGDAFTQFLETDDPSQYVFFVPEEGGTRWIDNMAIPFDAPHPCTAHTFINWILDGENGADLSNWNYYGTPNAASLDLLDEELNEFLVDPEVLVGGLDSVESIEDTGEFETNYSDAFTTAKG